MAAEAIRSRLRDRVRRFLSSDSRSREPVVRFLRSLERRGWAAFVFGGFARDILLGPPGSRPRDIDLVVGTSAEELRSQCTDLIVGQNRFGGLKLRVADWPIDIWAAEDTWALRMFPGKFRGLSDLPKTTFFNIESVLISVSPDNTGPRAVLEHGFVNSILNRVLEVNFAENPFPALCVVRSFYISLKLNFALGPQLCHYLTEARRKLSLREVLQAQIHHYGRIRLSEQEIEKCWSYVTHRTEAGLHKPVRFPRVRETQLLLWDFEEATEPMIAIA